MTNPLVEFDSPRKFANHPDNGGITVQATGIVRLGPGIAATLEPKSPQPGEVQYLRLSTTGPSAAEFNLVQANLATAQNDITLLTARVAVLETALAAATAAATPETLAKRNSSGDLAVNLLRPAAVRANAENVGVSLQGNNGSKGVEVVYDGTEMKIGFLGGTPGGKIQDLTGDSLQDRFDNLMYFLAQMGLVQQFP